MAILAVCGFLSFGTTTIIHRDTEPKKTRMATVLLCVQGERNRPGKCERYTNSKHCPKSTGVYSK